MMFPYRLTVCLAFAFSSVVQAGAVIDVIPAEPGPYLPGQSLTMDVFLTQGPGGSYRGLRGVQFDFADTDPALQLDPRFTFDYSTVAIGGANYVDFANFPDPATLVPATMYFGFDYPNGNPFDPFEGVGWSNAMLVLPPDSPLRVGSFGVTLPSQRGEYVIDVMNADTLDPNRGARLDYGFWVQPGDPRTIWRPSDLDQLAGGVFTASATAGEGFTFGYTPVSGVIVPEPATLFLVGIGTLGMILRRHGTRVVRKQVGCILMHHRRYVDAP